MINRHGRLCVGCSKGTFSFTHLGEDGGATIPICDQCADRSDYFEDAIIAALREVFR